MNLGIKTLATGEKAYDIPTLDALFNARNAYTNSKRRNQKKSKFYDAFIAFLDFCIQYILDEYVRKPIPSDENLALLVFKNSRDITLQEEYKRQLFLRLHVAMLYADQLKKIVSQNNIDAYVGLSKVVEHDYSLLICTYEFLVKGNKTSHYPQNSVQVQYDTILKDANKLLYMERYLVSDMSHLRVCNIFLIRQLLETAGRRLIGYASIVDENGRAIHQFSQAPWDYLKKAEQVSLIQLPVKARMIFEINKWTNMFVHTAMEQSCYLQFYALHLINKLFKPISTPIRIYDGTYKAFHDCGDFQIPDWGALKTHFEKTIKDRVPNAQIDWLAADNVGGYILSMGKYTPTLEKHHFKKFTIFNKIEIKLL